MKTCTSCGEAKPFGEYSRHKLGRDGLRPRCKSCCSAEKKAWKEANRERIRASDAAYYAQNREAVQVGIKRWNSENRGLCDAATLRWRERNPELVLAQRYRHRIRKRYPEARGLEYATGERLAARIALYGGLCAYCGGDADTLDHRIPLRLGGSALPANVVPACRSCNSRKRNKKPSEFCA